MLTYIAKRLISVVAGVKHGKSNIRRVHFYWVNRGQFVVVGVGAGVGVLNSS